MRFAGIDIASETHVVAVVDNEGKVVVKATSFGEDAAGYERLLELLGPPEGCLVAMEATGHYWQNLFAALAAAGFQVALLNPIRTHHFAKEEMARTRPMRSTRSASLGKIIFFFIYYLRIFIPMVK